MLPDPNSDVTPCASRAVHASHWHGSGNDVAYCTGVKPPQTWAIPPEPGPEVKAIRTERWPDVLLVRVDGVSSDGTTWWYVKHDDGSLGGRSEWDYLIRNDGVITDATREWEES